MALGSGRATAPATTVTSAPAPAAPTASCHAVRQMRSAPILFGKLWCDLVIREFAALFPEDGGFNDDLVRELNAALATHGAPYRLTKGVA